MTSINSEKFDNLLPTDSELFSRTQNWSKLIEKYADEADLDSCFEFDSDSDIDDENFKESESVGPSDFEDSAGGGDSNFNVNDVLNKTQNVIAKRRAKWNECGIDRIMDSFCYDNITEKVGDWLKTSSGFLPESNSNTKSYVNEIQLNKQHIVVEHRSSDQNSLDSVDTAKYILSNRKRKKSRVTMTIKNYCYSAKKSFPFDDEVFSNRVPAIMKENTPAAGRSKSDSYCKHNKVISKAPPTKKQKLRARRHPSRQVESSSSSDCRPHSPHKKRVPRTQSVNKSSSAQNKKISNEKRTKKIVKPLSNNLSLEKPELELSSLDSNSFINSTALKTHHSMVNHKEKFTEKCKKLNDNNTLSRRRSEPIILYSPDIPETHKRLRNGHVEITEDDLEKSLGKAVKDKYLAGCKKFNYECSKNSKLIFLPPQNCTDETSDSDDDILENLSRMGTGRIIEEVQF